MCDNVVNLTIFAPNVGQGENKWSHVAVYRTLSFVDPQWATMYRNLNEGIPLSDAHRLVGQLRSMWDNDAHSEISFHNVCPQHTPAHNVCYNTQGRKG